MTSQFGLRLPVAGPLASTGAIRRVAVEGERLGYHTLWVHDYIVWTRELDRTHISCGSAETLKEDQAPLFFESLTSLSFVAGLTERIRLGTAVLCLPYRQPVVVAKQVANLDVLSGGRLTLGIGVGAPRRTHNQDFEVLGVPRVEKYERATEYLEAMKRIWTMPHPSFDGQFVSFPETEIDPKPVQRPHPPIWIGGSGPRAMEMVAASAQGWLPTWLTPDGYRTKIGELHDLATAHGRDGSELTIGTEIVIAIATTDSEALRSSRATVETLTAGFTVRTPDEAAATSLIGSPATISERVQRYVEAGVDHFELKFVYHSIDHLIDQMTLFHDEVMPSFGHEAAA